MLLFVLLPKQDQNPNLSTVLLTHAQTNTKICSKFFLSAETKLKATVSVLLVTAFVYVIPTDSTNWIGYSAYLFIYFNF